MRTLRISQTSRPDGQHQVQLTLDGDATQAPHSATARFEFEVSAQDREDLRWYLEDYLEYPLDPAPRIAARVEQRMVELGKELFSRIFGSEDARDLWATMRDRLPETRLEIISDTDADAALPWELVRDPKTGSALAAEAHTFVRAQHQNARCARMPQPADGERIRVLLVISRPAGAEDVPFRSVARHLARLNAEYPETFQLDVLRPATFARLAQVLRQAKDRGTPYHVVHFDGHGTWTELPAEDADAASVELEAVRYSHYSVLSPRREGVHGYLVFEDPDTTENQQLVDGPALGDLLFNAGVPVLVLNACQSAHADLSTAPEKVDTGSPHERVRTYGSLAQELVDAGVAGVVAMRYSVYVVTAAQFIADVYAALLQGHPLGTAVTRGRKDLKEQPNREIAFESRSLQDWVVPVVYEAAPLKLFPGPRQGEQTPSFTLRRAPTRRERAQPDFSQRLPDSPDVGFYGRDETLLALDRAFDNHRIVLLHAYAGAGKTTTAAEFARWYQLTGGITGPVLFTSFEHHRTLPQVLDQLGQEFEEQLEAQGVQWLTLSDTERREIALQVLRQVPVLWIWDNVEPVTGFPAGTESAWNQAEQDELTAFLREIRDTKTRVLLTSRRDERAWLGNLPLRIPLPPMPMTDRVQLARTLAERHGHRLTEVEDWRPLLTYTQGNPLTVTVVVGQALRDQVHTRQQLKEFVDRLRACEADLDDDQTQGRTRSLGASLTYGLKHAFNEQELRVLAPLHLYQEFIDVDTLCGMGDPKVVGETVVPAVRGLTRQVGITLLDRAAEIGLVTAYGDGYYGIHPALPWYLQDLFTQTSEPLATPDRQVTKRVYATAIARLGAYYHRQYNQGRTEVIGLLRFEEANLLHAWTLARAHGWWEEVIEAMQGLRELYEHTGQWAAMARLVEKVTPDITDPASDGPRPGREDIWQLLTEYRVWLAKRTQDWPTVQRLQPLVVAWTREQAVTALVADPAALDKVQHGQVRSLAGALHELAAIQLEQQQQACVDTFHEALDLFKRIGDRRAEATTAYNLGNACLMLPEMQDLNQAESWFRYSLELFEATDRINIARSTCQLGRVHWRRFFEAQAAGRPSEELAGYLRASIDAYQQALDLIPPDAVSDLAVVHYRLGEIADASGQLAVALDHYRTSIRYHETTGNRYAAAHTRSRVALALGVRRRYEQALEWALAALHDYQSYGDRDDDMIAETRQLIENIQMCITDGQT